MRFRAVRGTRCVTRTARCAPSCHAAPLRLKCRLSCSSGVAFTCRRCVDRAYKNHTGTGLRCAGHPRSGIAAWSFQHGLRHWSVTSAPGPSSVGLCTRARLDSPHLHRPLPRLHRDCGSPQPRLRRDWGSPLPRLRRDWGSPLPHLRRDWGSARLPVPSVLRRRSLVRGGARGSLPLH